MQQTSPGLYTWWEGTGEENTFHLWEDVRGWSKPAARHAALLDGRRDPGAAGRHARLRRQSGQEPVLVIGGGVPKPWVGKPMRVAGLPTSLGLVDWRWRDGKMQVTIHGRREPQIRLGATLQGTIHVEQAKERFFVTAPRFPQSLGRHRWRDRRRRHRGLPGRRRATGQIAAIRPERSSRAPIAPYNAEYRDEHLNRVAFPLGGIGAGMICLEGSGALSHFSLRNRPEVFNEPCTFAAIAIKGPQKIARVLQGPVPGWKLFGAPGSGNGAGGTSFGLPRFRKAVFTARFPFAAVQLTDSQVPLEVELTAWSPFEPGDADSSSLPVAALEYRFTNQTAAAVEAVFSFSARNFTAVGANPQAVKAAAGGFILWGGGGTNGGPPGRNWPSRRR